MGGGGVEGGGRRGPAPLLSSTRYYLWPWLSAQSRMQLSTPLSPRAGSGLFEFLTAWTEGRGLGRGGPQPRPPPLQAASPQTVTARNVGGGRATVPEKKGLPGVVPLTISPISSPFCCP